MSKLLDDAKAAGFYVDINGIITVGAGVWKNTRNKPLNEKLAKFAALQIPDGYKLVPIEPTDEMLQAFITCKSWLDSDDGAKYKLLSSFNGDMGEPYYKAMLKASLPNNTEE